VRGSERQVRGAGAASRRILPLVIALAAALLVAPAVAQAETNCCFELAVDHDSTYVVSYGSDGLGYDGAFRWTVEWYLRAIVEYDDGELDVRRARSQVQFEEFSNVTRCRTSDRPCFDRERVPCNPGAVSHPDGRGGTYYYTESRSKYRRGGGASISGRGAGATLYALPPDRTYHSVFKRYCFLGHGHHGYGEEGDEVGGERSVHVKAPNKRFMRVASSGDRCSYRFTDSLSLGPDHVGSDSAAPHSWTSNLSVRYRLSAFPKSRLPSRADQLASLPDPAEPFVDDGWGKGGTGKRTC
jgi:hypothetical protein